MPGFINSHMHFYSTMVRGLGKAAPSKDFKEILENLWWRLDKKLTVEDSYYSALLPLVDAIKHGTTTLIDHHASPFAVRGSLNRIADAVKETGLRASLCYELSDRDGPEIAQEGIDENVAFIKRCAKEKDPQLKALFGLHASFTINDGTLEKAAAAGHELGAGFHVHTAEAKSDQDYNEKHFGLRVVQRLNKFGILGPKTITAHCVHVNEDEFNLLRDTGTAVAHNPQSNMNNAVGVADIIKMSAKGVLVGLGTDAMTVNMLEEVRVALWAQHLSHNNPSTGFMEALGALMFNNAKIANRYWNPKVGVLQEGYAADVILMDYWPPTPFDESTFLGHLGFGLSQSFVDTTICGGKVLMEGKKLKIDLDEREVAAKSLELSQKLWQRF
jgi:putative selenium metabolism protein SsnA